VPFEFLPGTFAVAIYYLLATAEASSNLARFDGVRYGQRASADELTALYARTRGEGFGPEVRRRILLGTYALSAGYHDEFYLKAQRARTRIVREYAAAFARCDVMLLPATPSLAFKLGEKTDDPLAMYLNDFFTVPMSLAGIPAISIPAGLAEPDGGGPQLPVGLQIAAPAFAEQRMLDAAYALEQAIGFAARPSGALVESEKRTESDGGDDG
jgi:aspartyl-tRNA(Asn)/glutamyl-tRNA(Gln) amidotransferase subunit A